ncbi:transposase [Desulfobotulus sp. H1]|uniref:Transposase n=1 Tax=Desulfobotulus pelophilus TaxID=2823377 RepID=A0ABT3ND12_9BACT|nr:transposase [Desulfobotulus pelophilus]MCW7755344.1 transposase [Desulfobotulus pelophilus]
MRKKRHNYSAQEKVTILKRHLVDRVAVSDVCDEYDLQPTVFYRWQKEFFENGAAAFEKSNSARNRAEQKRIEQLEAKLQAKNEVLSELMEEHVQLKKERGVR